MNRKVLDERDHALVAEVVGYLRGIAFGSDAQGGDSLERAPSMLAHRLELMERRLWPVDE